MKSLYLALALVLMLGGAFAQSIPQTPNLHLNEPPYHYQRWDTPNNANWTTLDSLWNSVLGGCGGDGSHGVGWDPALHFICVGITGTNAPGGSPNQLQYNNAGALGGFNDGTAHQVLHGLRTFGPVTRLDTDSTIAQTGVDINSSFQVTSLHLSAPCSIAMGCTGTSTPSLIGGTNCTITGSWPNQTVTCIAVAPASTASQWNPSVLGVSWASDFNAIAGQIINVKTDTRVSPQATGNGSTDDTAAIRAAIVVATSLGGATLYFPAGNYKIIVPSAASSPSPLVIPSNVILRGLSNTASIIHVNDTGAASATNNTATWGGINFSNSNHVGISDLKIVNDTSAGATHPNVILWNRNGGGETDVFLNNVDIELSNGKAVWLTSVTNLLLLNSTVATTNDCSVAGSGGDQSATSVIYFENNTNMTITGNTINYQCSRIFLAFGTNTLINNNTITRDAQNVDFPTQDESGGLEISFSNQIQVLKNTLSTVNFPYPTTGNFPDGETILAQDGSGIGGFFIDAGSVTSTTSNTLTDSGASWGSGSVAKLANAPTSTMIVIISGAQAGEVATISSMNTGTKTLTLTAPWAATPANGSLYMTVVWSLANAVIKDNILTNNPQGILAYSGCYNCLIQGNIITDSGQILLRTIDQLSSGEVRRYHNVQLNTRVLNNTVMNTKGLTQANILIYTNSVGADGYTGYSDINVELGNNTVVPWSNNPSLVYPSANGVVTQEGLLPCFLFGTATLSPTSVIHNLSYHNNLQTLPVNYVYPNISSTDCVNWESATHITDEASSLSNKPYVDVVATSNLTLSGTQTIDGVVGSAGTTVSTGTYNATIVLATAQSTPSQNGPWVMQSGAWTRPVWYPSGGSTQALHGATVSVSSGTKYAGSTWRLTTATPIISGVVVGVIIIDTTSTAWAQVQIATSVQLCGTTTTCAKTAQTAPIIVYGTVALSSGTPSTATITALPFSGTTNYVCSGTNQTNAANNLIKFANASASSTVITGPNTLTDVIGYQCIGN